VRVLLGLVTELATLEEAMNNVKAQIAALAKSTAFQWLADRIIVFDRRPGEVTDPRG
jgi:hypothetical protein